MFRLQPASFFYSIFLAGIGLLTMIGFGQACAPSFNAASYVGDSSANLGLSKTCAPPDGVSGSPKTIEEVVTLINSLPKPVTVPCFIESLDRPLNVSLTYSESSAQPSGGARSPRIFIMIDKLFISVVPEGLGRDFVELSYMTTGDLSIKAEIEFPIVTELSRQAPYERISEGYGTSCGFCHKGERQVTSITFTKAFESKAIQPDVDTLVDISSLKRELSACNFQQEPERCSMIKALLSFGEVRSKRFPSSIPYSF